MDETKYGVSTNVVLLFNNNSTTEHKSLLSSVVHNLDNFI